MRRKNKEEIEKTEKMLRSVKPPELSNDEVESYKEEFIRVLLEKYSEITHQREKSHTLRVRLAYGLSVFAVVIALFSFLYVKPYIVKVATANIIKERLQYKVNLKDVIVKDGVGIIIYNCEEVTVNTQSKTVEIYEPVEFTPSEEEKGRAIEIVRNSQEAKHYVPSEGEAPQDISKGEVVFIKGLLFPNSGKKLLVVSIAYTPQNYPEGQFLPSAIANFTVDIEKGEVKPKDIIIIKAFFKYNHLHNLKVSY
jgi:hypothetical protein